MINADQLRALADLLEQAEQEEPDGDWSLYLPQNLPENFYYDAEGLKKLSKVDSGVFRRLLGIS